MSWRVVNLALLAAAVVAVPLSHSALSQKKNGGPHGPAPKVQICHFPDDSTVGHVIEVSQNAVAAHIAKHGDCTTFVTEETGGCRCLTCEEQCQADAESCRAACDPDDTECLDGCAAALTECLAGCGG
jgi:hypothetical protein